MDLRQALKEQYHAALVMLAQCVERCPDDLWTQGVHPRAYWQIAAHATYFAHNYLVQDEEAFIAAGTGWPPAVKRVLGLTGDKTALDVEPYDLPEDATPFTRQEALEFIAFVDQLDLDAADTGFSWYRKRNMTKISHVLLSIRHIQGHVGQLSELLMLRGIDIDWVSVAGRAES
jgi:hypothetical protein